MIKKHRKLLVVMAVMILTLSIASTGFAANTMKNLQAYYKNITIFKNGTQANFTHEPFIVDGTTYVPVRDMSELLGKAVTFNPTTYRIDIADVADASTVALQTKMIQQEIEITTLNAKVKELEAKLTEKEKETNITSVNDLEKALNKNYGTYSKVDFDIDLTESKTKKTIDVEIYIDLYDDYTAWKKLDKDDITEYVQDIVDDIRKSFKDHTITGFIYDEEDEIKLYSFTVNKRSQVLLSTKTSGVSSSISDLDDLEDYLNDYYGDYAGINFYFYLSGDEDYITVYIEADEDDFDLKSSGVKTFLNKIYADIIYEFTYAEVDGYIDEYYSGDELYEFDFDYDDGYLNLY